MATAHKDLKKSGLPSFEQIVLPILYEPRETQGDHLLPVPVDSFFSAEYTCGVLNAKISAIQKLKIKIKCFFMLCSPFRDL